MCSYQAVVDSIVAFMRENNWNRVCVSIGQVKTALQQDTVVGGRGHAGSLG